MMAVRKVCQKYSKRGAAKNYFLLQNKILSLEMFFYRKVVYQCKGFQFATSYHEVIQIMIGAKLCTRSVCGHTDEPRREPDDSLLTDPDYHRQV